MGNPELLSPDERIRNVEYEIVRLRTEAYHRAAREQEKRSADNRLWIMGVYCLVCGIIIGQKAARERLEREAGD